MENNKKILETTEVLDNEKISESVNTLESVKIQENISVNELPDDKESKSSGKEKKPETKLDKALGKLTSVTGTFVALAATYVVASSTLVNMNMDATITSFEYKDGHIAYAIEVEEFSSENTLTFYIAEDGVPKGDYLLVQNFTDIVQNSEISSYYLYDKDYQELETYESMEDLQSFVDSMAEDQILKFASYEYLNLGEQEFEITKNGKKIQLKGSIALDNQDIQSKLDSSDNVSIKYTATLKGDVGLVNRTFDNYVIKIDKVTSEFTNIEGHCDCKNSGYFYFTMNFVDDLGKFTDFTAYILDADGVKKACYFTEDLHAEQGIYVLELRGGPATLVVSFMNDGIEVIKEIDITI